MSKRKSFAHEQELRAVIYNPERFAGISGTYPIPEHKRNYGMHAATDLDLLIEQIRVLPDASAEFRKSIDSLCDKYGLKKDVKQSRLDDDPLY